MKDYNIYFCRECVLGKWTTIQALERTPTTEEEVNVIEIICDDHN